MEPNEISMNYSSPSKPFNTRYRAKIEAGYFTINFGSSIEVLTERLPKRVRANIHGVARTIRRQDGQERVSYVVFLDSDLGGDIYQYQGNAPVRVQSVKDFAIQEVSRTYDGVERLL